MGRFQTILQIFIVSLGLWLFNPGDCLAFTHDYGFDIYFPNYEYPLGEWWDLLDKPDYERFDRSYGVVSTTTQYQSGMASLSEGTTTSTIIASTTNPTEFSFWTYLKNTTASGYQQEFYFRDDSFVDNPMRFSINYHTSYGVYWNWTDSVASKQWRFWQDGTRNTWYKITIKFASTTCDFYVNDTFATTTTLQYSHTANDITAFTAGGIDNKLYIDEMQIKDDELNINEPDVEIIELPEWTGDVVVMSENFSFENPMYCTVGYSCRLWINYPISSVGDTVYLIDENVSEVITSQELIGGQLMKDYLTLPSQDTAQTINYYVVDEGATTTAYKLQVIWSEENTALLDLFAQYNCDTVCNDLATSTNLWEQIDYGLQCATRKGVCWLFVPDQDTLMAFSESINTIKNNFPFTVYYQVKTNIFDINLASTTASNISTNNIIPGLNVVLASSTMMTTAWGSVWTSFYQALTYIIYLLGFSYFVWRLFAITQKRDDDDV